MKPTILVVLALATACANIAVPLDVRPVAPERKGLRVAVNPDVVVQTTSTDTDRRDEVSAAVRGEFLKALDKAGFVALDAPCAVQDLDVTLSLQLPDPVYIYLSMEASVTATVRRDGQVVAELKVAYPMKDADPAKPAREISGEALGPVSAADLVNLLASSPQLAALGPMPLAPSHQPCPRRKDVATKPLGLPPPPKQPDPIVVTPNVEGNWDAAGTIFGTDGTGQRLSIRHEAGSVYRVRRTTASDELVSEGIALLDGSNLHVAYHAPGSEVYLMISRAVDGKKMVGHWADSLFKNGEMGEETAETEYGTPTYGGTYKITGQVPYGKTYSGKFNLFNSSAPYAVSYEFDGSTQRIHGVADRVGNSLVVATLNAYVHTDGLWQESFMYDSSNVGLATYRVVGHLMTGTSAMDVHGEMRRGGEVLTRAMVALAPGEEPVESLAKACPAKPAACTTAAHRMLDGHGVIPDAKAAGTFLEKGCLAGDVAACDELGVLERDGFGRTNDDAAAVGHFRTACDKGFPPGCQHHAEMLRVGRGVPHDTSTPFERLAKACEAGDAGACNGAGALSEVGEQGAARDPAKAKERFQKACELESGDGCTNLGRLRELTSATRDDTVQAVAAYDSGCTRGVEQACTSAKELRKLLGDGLK